MAAGFFIWQSQAEAEPAMPPAPAPQPAAFISPIAPQSPPEPPSAPEKTKEEKLRPGGQNKGGRITRDELLQSRRKAFAKLDKKGRRAAQLRRMGGDDPMTSSPRPTRTTTGRSPTRNMPPRLRNRNRSRIATARRQSAACHSCSFSLARLVYSSLRSAFFALPSTGGNRPKLTFIG
jgi:hypothetical protein